MAEQQDDAQRTEEPTPKRLEEARRKGDAPKSQELVAAGMLGAGALALTLFGADAAEGLARIGAAFLDHPHAFAVDARALTRLFANVAMSLAAIGAGAGLLFVAAAILVNAGQARPVLTTARMAPSLQKISPIAGLKRIFGPSGLFNFIKGLFKIVIVGAIMLYALWPQRDLLMGLMEASERELLRLAAREIIMLLVLAVAAMLVIGALDFAHQRSAWLKRNRMTKEEVRRELKETEGDPLIRGRVKRDREARARRRMLVAVKDATVLIMNPTHFAVALKYEEGSAAAPVCVAKGADELALRLKAVALENAVPVVENPPLARALFAGAELDAEIPVEHYEAVAGVISFVLRKARAAGGPPRTGP